MLSIQLTKTGGPEVLQESEVPMPKITEDIEPTGNVRPTEGAEPPESTVLIRTKACSVNRIDIWQRSGKYPIKLPHIMGSDCAGIIVETSGTLPANLKIGSEIIVNPAIPCQTNEGQTNENPSAVKIFGFNTEGSYAEYVRVPTSQIYLKPQSLSWEQAGAFPLTFLTAWHMLCTRANLKNNEKVLIFGASGGLGSSAIQIAKMLGAEVFAVTRSKEKHQALLQIGADQVLSPNEIPNQTFNVVFDSVGTETFNLGIKSLKPHGRLVLAGTTSGKDAELDLADLYARELTILGARMGTKEDFEAVYEHVKNGRLKPVIGATFPLKDASLAHKLMEDGKTLGKIVLTV